MGDLFHKVYLAGPISGCSWDEATAWRREAPEVSSIKYLSPLRGKIYLKNEDAIKSSYTDHILSTVQGILSRDFYDVRSCDLVVANLTYGDRVSIGTIVEVTMALENHKPVILVIDRDDSPYHHCFISQRESVMVVRDLDTAWMVMKQILAVSETTQE